MLNENGKSMLPPIIDEKCEEYALFHMQVYIKAEMQQNTYNKNGIGICLNF